MTHSPLKLSADESTITGISDGRNKRAIKVNMGFLSTDEVIERRVVIIRSVNALPSLVEALEKSAEAWANALELGLLPKQHRITAANLRDEARAALALAKGE